MRKGPLLVVLALASVAVAGCAGTRGQPERTGAAAPEQLDGLVRGVVVDNALHPLANATVTLAAEPHANRTTGRDGTFNFTGLRRGAYPIQASLRYYTTALVVVVAEPAGKAVTLSLDPLPLDRPSIVQAVYAGFHNASIVAGSPIIHQGELGTDYVFDRVPAFLQTEVVWQPSTEAAREMDLGWYRHGCDVGSGICMNRTLGPSPLEYHRTKAQLLHGVYLDNGTFSFRVLVADLSETRPPTVCDPVGLTCTAGVGLSVQQRFDVYTTSFFNFEPPEGWRFTSDGLPPLPP